MGQTFSIICDTCKEELSIGQNSLGTDDHLWTNENDIKKLQDFLFKHLSSDYWSDMKHDLRFMEAQEIPLDYKDVDPEEYA